MKPLRGQAAFLLVHLARECSCFLVGLDSPVAGYPGLGSVEWISWGSSILLGPTLYQPRCLESPWFNTEVDQVWGQYSFIEVPPQRSKRKSKQKAPEVFTSWPWPVALWMRITDRICEVRGGLRLSMQKLGQVASQTLEYAGYQCSDQYHAGYPSGSDHGQIEINDIAQAIDTLKSHPAIRRLLYHLHRSLKDANWNSKMRSSMSNGWM